MLDFPITSHCTTPSLGACLASPSASFRATFTSPPPAQSCGIRDTPRPRRRREQEGRGPGPRPPTLIWRPHPPRINWNLMGPGHTICYRFSLRTPQLYLLTAASRFIGAGSAGEGLSAVWLPGAQRHALAPHTGRPPSRTLCSWGRGMGGGETTDPEGSLHT